MTRLRLLRTGVLLLLTGVLCSLFFHTLWDLQVLRGAEYRARSMRAGSAVVSVAVARGAITDRNGTVLVDDRLCCRVVLGADVSPAELRALADLCARQGAEYTLPEPGRSEGHILVADADTALVAALRELDLSGVSLETAAVRQYHTACAAHLLGRTGPVSGADWPEYQARGYAFNERVGRDGAERAFETVLHGVPGRERLDADGTVAETLSPPQPGSTVQLTLDLRLQETAEEALARFIADTPGAEGGAAVVIEVGTGEILAAASYPSYDPATFNELYGQLAADPLHPLFNRAFQGLYAPGSTFKMVTAVAALEEGVITPDTRIRDTGVFTAYRDYQPACWLYRQRRATHGLLNVSEALAVSCNVFFYTLGYQLGIDLLDYYALRFGLGRPTGVELPESVGSVAGPARSEQLGTAWFAGSTLAAAIGQSDHQFTPLQLASYTATLAAGGKRYTPHLLRAVCPADGSAPIVSEPEPEATLSLAPETLTAVTAGMRAVTESGGTAAAYFADFDIPVAAKTGSAQVAQNAHSNAVFVCFAPADKPEIAMALVVEKGGGGAALASVARELLDCWFYPDS